jgi:hypothetical protein
MDTILVEIDQMLYDFLISVYVDNLVVVGVLVGLELVLEDNFGM